MRRTSLFSVFLFFLLSQCKAKTKKIIESTEPASLKPITEDVSGVSMTTLSLAENQKNIFEYQFIKGQCAKGREGKVYSTYENQVSFPVLSQQEGPCTIQYRLCEGSCTDWVSLDFHQKAQDPSRDELASLLKTQFEKEQELQDLALSISQKIDELAPNQKNCLDKKKLAEMDVFLDLSPKEISALLKYDFSQQETDVLNQLSGVDSNKESETGSEVKKEDISKIAAYVGIPVALALFIRAGVTGYEVYRWHHFLENERTDHEKKIKYVRHSSGLFVPKDQEKDSLEKIGDVARFEDPAYKTLYTVGESKKFVKFLTENQGWKYDNRNWYKKGDNGKKVYLDFQRKELDAKKLRHNIDFDQLDKRAEESIQARQKSKKIASLRSSFDPQNGHIITQHFGTKGRITLAMISGISAILGTVRAVQAIRADNTTKDSSMKLASSDICTSFYSTLKSLSEDLKKAALIKNELIITKFKIQADL